MIPKQIYLILTIFNGFSYSNNNLLIFNKSLKSDKKYFILNKFINILESTINHNDCTFVNHFYMEEINLPFKNRSIIIFNNIKSDYYQRPNNYLIYFETFHDLQHNLLNFIKSSSWNPRAKFIFLTENEIENKLNVSKLFKKYFINKFIVCVINKNVSVDFYSWKNYDLSEIYRDQNVSIDLITQIYDNIIKKNNFFPKKYYKNFNFLTYTIITLDVPPFCFKYQNEMHG